MKAQQLSIFVENRAGRLAEIIALLAGASINIRALSLADTSDFGILRMVVDKQEEAAALLKEKGFTIGRAAVVAVEMPDRPGSLAGILSLLSKNGINVEYMYASARLRLDQAVMIFRFDKIDEAIAALQANGLAIIPGEALESA